MLKKLTLAALLTGALALSNSAAAMVDRTLCVFDVVGANGDTYQMMKQYVLAAQQWGVNFELKPYTDEALAKSDFRAGHCDAVELFGLATRSILKFPGSLDMMAALPSYDGLSTAVAALSDPNAAPLMKEGRYENAGIIPGGKVYLFSHDRNILDDWEKLAGKRITVISEDEQAVEMIKYIGGTVMPALVSTFAGMFNSNSADLSYAPAFAYQALEMYKGLGENGGILRYNLGILTFQVTLNHDRFPTGFAQHSRAWVYENMWDVGMRLVKKAEATIPTKYWVNLSTNKEARYNEMFSNVRQRLYDADRVYSRRMQRMLKTIRCRELPDNAECTQDTEGGPAI